MSEKIEKKIEKVLDRHSPLETAIKKNIANDIYSEIVLSGLLEIIERLETLEKRISGLEKIKGITLKERINNENEN